MEANAIFLDVHYLVAHGKENGSRKRLGEEVGEIINCSNIWDHQATAFDHFPNEEVTTSNVFGAVMVLRIVGKIPGCSVVHGQVRRLILRNDTKLLEKDPKVHGLLGRLGGSHDLRFAG